MTKRHLALSSAVIVLLAGAASADTWQRHGGYGGYGGYGSGSGHHMGGATMPMHGTMGGYGTMPGHGAMGDHGAMPGYGAMGASGMHMMGGMPGAVMREILDEDGDGVVTPEEARSALEALRAEYDADGDGTLTLEEFEALHSALIRETMVDRFQHLDADGDGQVTDEEMQAPTQRVNWMQSMHERMMRGGETTPLNEMPWRNRMMDGTGGPMHEDLDN